MVLIDKNEHFRHSLFRAKSVVRKDYAKPLALYWHSLCFSLLTILSFFANHVDLIIYYQSRLLKCTSLKYSRVRDICQIFFWPWYILSEIFLTGYIPDIVGYFELGYFGPTSNIQNAYFYQLKHHSNVL